MSEDTTLRPDELVTVTLRRGQWIGPVPNGAALSGRLDTSATPATYIYRRVVRAEISRLFEWRGDPLILRDADMIVGVDNIVLAWGSPSVRTWRAACDASLAASQRRRGIQPKANP